MFMAAWLWKKPTNLQLAHALFTRDPGPPFLATSMHSTSASTHRVHCLPSSHCWLNISNSEQRQTHRIRMFAFLLYNLQASQCFFTGFFTSFTLLRSSFLRMQRLQDRASSHFFVIPNYLALEHVFAKSTIYRPSAP